MDYETIIEFWFSEIQPKQWWQKDEVFDQQIKDRFADWHDAAISGELFEWRQEALGQLAEVIVLDQFSRNIYRDQSGAFSADSMALTLAQEAVARGNDKQLLEQQRMFLYMPYMHSESKLIHTHAVALFSTLVEQGNLEFELKHKAIIDQFGRYPHRNKILGRTSTPEEVEFLGQPGSSF